MDSAKNGRWIIPFMKFSMVRVKKINRLKITYTTNKCDII